MVTSVEELVLLVPQLMHLLVPLLHCAQTVLGY